MVEQNGTSESGRVPDAYDRQLGALHDLPDVVKTKPATVRVVPPLGIGGTHIFVIQTYRQRERGDFVFLEVMGQTGATRLVLPPEVANTIARQRDAVGARVRSKTAKAAAEDRKARGILPGFMKSKAAVAAKPAAKRKGGKA